MEDQVCVDVLSVTNEDVSEKAAAEHLVSVDDDPTIKEKVPAARSAKKPPRPQQALSLDAAADQKLIKELAQLSMIKKARIERMKALLAQKKLASKPNNSSSLFAMIFTIIVFIVIIFQGMSCQISCGTLEGGSPPPQHETNENGFIFIHQELNPSVHDSV